MQTRRETNHFPKPVGIGNGASLLYSGAADLWTLFQLSRWTKEYRKIHPVEVDPVDLD